MQWFRENAQALKGAAWGVVGGAVVTAVVGFAWGGWVTGGTAEKMASARAEKAVVAAYAPVCVDRFAASATPEQRTAFAEESSWRRDAWIEKAGFATPPGFKAPIDAVAEACATALSKQIEEAKQAKKG